ncbi:MAG TPA: septum formation initiator family protein [Dehalococcoidia bacterium]|nr:septum formation initiator family protein [Dehalococcoidia bacterium]
MLRLPEVRVPTFGPAQIVMAVVALLLVLFAYSAFQSATQAYQLREFRRSLEADVFELREQRAELQGLLTYLESDEYIEAVGRDQFGLVFPGEVAVSVDAPPPLEQRAEAGRRWWETLFDR